MALTHGDGGVVLIDGPEGVPRGQEEGREVVLPRERVSERVGFLFPVPEPHVLPANRLFRKFRTAPFGIVTF